MFGTQAIHTAHEKEVDKNEIPAIHFRGSPQEEGDRRGLQGKSAMATRVVPDAHDAEEKNTL